MAWDLGDIVPLTVNVQDATGAAGNATAVALTVTLPDGTTDTPAVSNPTTGTYQVDYSPTMPGRHVARWVATGTNASSYVDMFDVRSPDPGYVVSIADVKAHLGRAATAAADDEELRRMVEAATAIVEWKVGPVVARAHTDLVIGGGCEVLLPHRPIISLTSTAAAWSGGVPDAVADLDFDAESGRVWRSDGAPIQPRQRFTYRAGRAVVPANITTAALIIVAHLWETQRSGASGPSRIIGAEDVTAVPSLGFAIPNRALEMLAPDARAPFLA
jgi:hypothetical protein